MSQLITDYAMQLIGADVRYYPGNKSRHGSFWPQKATLVPQVNLAMAATPQKNALNGRAIGSVGAGGRMA